MTGTPAGRGKKIIEVHWRAKAMQEELGGRAWVSFLREMAGNNVWENRKKNAFFLHCKKGKCTGERTLEWALLPQLEVGDLRRSVWWVEILLLF